MGRGRVGESRLGRFRIDKGKPSNRVNREVKGVKSTEEGRSTENCNFFLTP